MREIFASMIRRSRSTARRASRFAAGAPVFSAEAVPLGLQLAEHACVHQHVAELRPAAHHAAHERVAALGAEPLTLSQAEFQAMIDRELKENAELIKKAGIKAN